MHVFISYAKKDSWQFAVRLFNEINALEGMSAWMDSSLEPASSWARQIERELDRADCIVVLISPDVSRTETLEQTHSFVINEIQRALDARPRKVILPVLVQPSPVPVEIQSLQRIDATRDADEAIKQILEHLSQITSRASIIAESIQSQEKSCPSTLVLQRAHSRRKVIGGALLIGILGLGLLFNAAGGPSLFTPALPTPTAAYGSQVFSFVQMVKVPGGCFMMGSTEGEADEAPVAQVCVDDFWIDRTEVTNFKFEELAGQAEQRSGWGAPQRPRERITWLEARDFCAKRGARLPTEAEWEYAARGDSNLIYPWGNTFVADNVVFFRKCE